MKSQPSLTVLPSPHYLPPRDLLGGPSAPDISDQNAIKHDPSGGHTTVIGIGRVPVTDPGAAAALVQRAAAARSCEARLIITCLDRHPSSNRSLLLSYPS